jgi:hypothetical protein
LKIKGRKSSNIIDARDDKARAREEAKTKLDRTVKESPRALVDEPIAWNNDKNNKDRMLGVLYNPGRKANPLAPRHKLTKTDPEPQKISKGRRRKNYENIPDFEFFKHTTKGK